MQLQYNDVVFLARLRYRNNTVNNPFTFRNTHIYLSLPQACQINKYNYRNDKITVDTIRILINKLKCSKTKKKYENVCELYELPHGKCN